MFSSQSKTSVLYFVLDLFLSYIGFDEKLFASFFSNPYMILLIEEIWLTRWYVNILLFSEFYTSQVVVWDFWTINTIGETHGWFLCKLLDSWIGFFERYQRYTSCVFPKNWKTGNHQYNHKIDFSLLNGRGVFFGIMSFNFCYLAFRWEPHSPFLPTFITV